VAGPCVRRPEEDDLATDLVDQSLARTVRRHAARGGRRRAGPPPYYRGLEDVLRGEPPHSRYAGSPGFPPASSGAAADEVPIDIPNVGRSIQSVSVPPFVGGSPPSPLSRRIRHSRTFEHGEVVPRHHTPAETSLGPTPGVTGPTSARRTGLGQRVLLISSGEPFRDYRGAFSGLPFGPCEPSVKKETAVTTRAQPRPLRGPAPSPRPPPRRPRAGRHRPPSSRHRPPRSRPRNDRRSRGDRRPQ